jgi:hypothetical protein
MSNDRNPPAQAKPRLRWAAYFPGNKNSRRAYSTPSLTHARNIARFRSGICVVGKLATRTLNVDRTCAHRARQQGGAQVTPRSSP